MSQLFQKSLGTSLLSGARCPRSASCCSCPRPSTSWPPQKPQVPHMGEGLRTQDRPVPVLIAAKVTHFPLQKKDLTAERGWGPPVPTGSWGGVGTKLPASRLPKTLWGGERLLGCSVLSIQPGAHGHPRGLTKVLFIYLVSALPSGP